MLEKSHSIYVFWTLQVVALLFRSTMEELLAKVPNNEEGGIQTLKLGQRDWLLQVPGR